MRKNNKQSGIALITALLVAVVGFLMIIVALYIVYRGTEISGIEKRYETALETSHGVAERLGKEIIPNTMGGSLSGFVSGLSSDNKITLNVNDSCWSNKLTKDSTQWNCSSTSTFDLDTTADFSVEFSGFGMSDFTVFSKIVETMPGNSFASGLNVELEGSGVVESGSGMIKPMHIPYLYRIEFQGQLKDNGEEKANLSCLYEY